VRRREFIAGLGAASWPVMARGQQADRLRRVGVLMTLAADDPESQRRLAVFAQHLQQIGWTDGRNVRIEYRWSAGASGRMRRNIEELIALAPDVIVATAITSVEPLLQATRTIPVVFVIVPDPVGTGIVDSLARPGGNATGFMAYEFSIGTKWLELLKEIAPAIRRVAVLRDVTQPFAMSIFGAIQGMAPSFGVEVIPVGMREGSEIERSLETFARSRDGGLIPSPSAATVRHRELILTLAARHKLPAVYWERAFVTAGGLMSYGPDLIEQFRQTAGYVDRILKGEKPGDLPVQAPTKYQTVLNLKTAKALGLELPTSILVRADEVIE
jgi:ABC-type uncharacterized transport system substrate-binding protein